MIPKFRWALRESLRPPDLILLHICASYRLIWENVALDARPSGLWLCPWARRPSWQPRFAGRWPSPRPAQIRQAREPVLVRNRAGAPSDRSDTASVGFPASGRNPTEAEAPGRASVGRAETRLRSSGPADRRACSRLACGFDDVVAGFEDAVRQPVGAQVPPDGLDRVQLWRARRDRGFCPDAPASPRYRHRA